MLFRSFGDFKKRYGERAKEVMYATATKQAMKSEETEQIDEKSDPYAGASPDMFHHKLVNGKPNLPKTKDGRNKIGIRDIHLHHLGTGNPTAENAKYKVLAVGPKSPLAADHNLKVGSTIGGRDVNDHMDYGTGGGIVHVHTAKPKAHFLEDPYDNLKEGQSHQAKTTMKHIVNPTPGEKAAAKDIKPGIAGYRDRIAMLKSAEARGALKKIGRAHV